MATNIYVVRSLAERLLNIVHRYFEKEASRRGIPIPEDEDGFWEMYDPNEKVLLFKLVIDKTLNPKTLYKKSFEKSKVVYKETGPDGNEIEHQGFGFRDETIEIFLRFLKCPGENVFEQFRHFCDTKYDVEKENEAVKEKDVYIQFERMWASIPTVVNKLKKPVRTDIHDVIKKRADYLRVTYAPLFRNTSWWIYFYGYDKLNLKRNNGTWSLIKLIFWSRVLQSVIILAIS